MCVMGLSLRSQWGWKSRSWKVWLYSVYCLSEMLYSNTGWSEWAITSCWYWEKWPEQSQRECKHALYSKILGILSCRYGPQQWPLMQGSHSLWTDCQKNTWTLLCFIEAGNSEICSGLDLMLWRAVLNLHKIESEEQSKGPLWIFVCVHCVLPLEITETR